MIDLLWGSSATPDLNAYLIGWAAAHIPNCRRGFGRCVPAGVMDGDRLLGVVIYHNWDPEAGVIEMSGATTDSRWLARPVLRRMFEYPFLECHCQLVVMRVSENNKRLHRILAAYGFQAYRLPRLRGREEDEIVFLLTDDAWRTNKFNMRSSDGKSQHASAA